MKARGGSAKIHYAGYQRKSYQIWTSALLFYTDSRKNPVARSGTLSILGFRCLDSWLKFSFIKTEVTDYKDTLYRKLTKTRPELVLGPSVLSPVTNESGGNQVAPFLFWASDALIPGLCFSI